MRFSFRLKLALLTATVSAVPLVAVGVLLIDVNAREVESSNQALQIALAEHVATAVEARVRDAERALAAIAGALTDASLDDDARVALALRLLDAEPSIDAVAIYDADGALIDRMHPPGGAPPSTPEQLPVALREAARAGRGLSAARREGDAVHVSIAAPIRADGRVTGYVVAPVSLAPIQRRVARVSRSQLASERGAVMVVDAERRLLAHPAADRRLSTIDQAALPASVDALARVPTSGERTDARGEAWVVTAAGVEGLPWAVVVRVPREVAYASLAQMRRIVITTIALSLLAALVAAFLLARRLAAPIGRLVGFTEDLAARRFERRVEVRTSDELSVLGEALNGAAEELERGEARVRREEAIRADLGRYLPSELVEQIIRREQSMELGGQRRAITVLFADVVAFTPLSDRLPPEQVVTLLNELFTLLTEAVFRHGGTVDKFVGDCVMALFGAPAAQPDHAMRALAAAQDMLRFLESANEGWRPRFGVEVQLAVGVNTGEAVVGNVGSRTRMEYTAIGDVVNVAARLETIARPQQILVTRATAEAAREGCFELTAIGPREVPGRTAPVELYEVTW
ncbi:MAG TPA: adenylate/guanylate cyclase domain-containing protein [Sandaracinaceae bacterium LLY-WYZ-13_1]|nr:adenylate/guanylate cyclase domain-containing protein [Sandaracinaceae bacterium LLY-WYZ-13_1]